MKDLMENWRRFLEEAKYDQQQQVLNRASYSEMIQFKKLSDLFVPFGAKLMQRVFGDLKSEQTGFHITNLNGVYGLLNLQGSTKQVSVMTRGMNKKFVEQGITKKGGVVVELEGRVIASAGKDLFSLPEKGGRRNIALKMLRTMVPLETYQGLRNDIVTAIREYTSSDGSDLETLAAWREQVQTAKQEKNGAKLKEMIAFYLDSVEKVMLNYTDDLRWAFLTDHKSSEKNYQAMGIYDENLMDQIQLKNVYLLNTYYKKRGTDGFPTDDEFKTFASDMGKEGVELHTAKVSEIINKVVSALSVK